jgi:hypothetical protein
MRLIADIMSVIMDSLAALTVKNPIAMFFWAILFALFFIPFAIWWEECGKYKYKPWW